MDEQFFRVGEGLYTNMQTGNIQQKLLQKKNSQYPFMFFYCFSSLSDSCYLNLNWKQIKQALLIFNFGSFQH